MVTIILPIYAYGEGDTTTLATISDYTQPNSLQTNILQKTSPPLPSQDNTLLEDSYSIPLQDNTLQKQSTAPTKLKLQVESMSFNDWLNKKHCNFSIDKKDGQESLREEWHQTLGIDIFFPYFKVEEIKNKIEDKFHVRFFKMRGKLSLQKEEVKYTFRLKF